MSRCKVNWHDYLWLGMWSLRTTFFVADFDDAQRRAARLNEFAGHGASDICTDSPGQPDIFRVALSHSFGDIVLTTVREG